jgi:hypothetical protein
VNLDRGSVCSLPTMQRPGVAISVTRHRFGCHSAQKEAALITPGPQSLEPCAEFGFSQRLVDPVMFDDEAPSSSLEDDVALQARQHHAREGAGVEHRPARAVGLIQELQQWNDLHVCGETP